MGDEPKEGASAAKPVEPLEPYGSTKAPEPPAQPDYRDLFLRASAELENYRKRAERERAQLLQFAAEGVVRKLLDPYDSFERAIGEIERIAADAPPSVSPSLARSLDGLRAMKRQLWDLLSAEGVAPIAAAGAEFDPELHEALVRLPSSSLPSGKVLEVLQPGYTMRGKLVRPARVAVSSGPAAPEPAEGSAPRAPSKAHPGAPSPGANASAAASAAANAAPGGAPAETETSQPRRKTGKMGRST